MLQLFDGSLASYGTVYRQLAPVRTVVDFIADAIATTPLKVYRRTDSGRPEARDHGLAELIRHPHPELTPQRLIWGTVADLAIYGQAYWRKIQVGQQRAVVPMPPFRITPRGGLLLSPSQFDFQPFDGGAPIPIPRDQVVHFKLYDPEDRRIGSSKLAALKNVLREEVEASRNRRGFWRNAARPDMVLLRPEGASPLSDGASVRLREDWQATYAGPDNAGKTAILEEGMKPEALSAFSPKDAEFVQGRKFILEATAHVFNIPLAVLSLTETATFASQREFRKQLYTEVLPPWFEIIQSEIELQLLPWFIDQNVFPEFEVEAKLRGDFVDQAGIVLDAVGRPYMTLAEGRKLFNLADRNEPDDDKMVIPVGPNLALEGETPLAPVTALPRAASPLAAFFERQERSVLPRLGAGMPFDRERWTRELAPLVGSKDAAERINLRTELELSEGGDPREVFRRLRQGAQLHIAQ